MIFRVEQARTPADAEALLNTLLDAGYILLAPPVPMGAGVWLFFQKVPPVPTPLPVSLPPPALSFTLESR